MTDTTPGPLLFLTWSPDAPTPDPPADTKAALLTVDLWHAGLKIIDQAELLRDLERELRLTQQVLALLLATHGEDHPTGFTVSRAELDAAPVLVVATVPGLEGEWNVQVGV